MMLNAMVRKGDAAAEEANDLILAAMMGNAPTDDATTEEDESSDDEDSIFKAMRSGNTTGIEFATFEEADDFWTAVMQDMDAKRERNYGNESDTTDFEIDSEEEELEMMSVAEYEKIRQRIEYEQSLRQHRQMYPSTDDFPDFEVVVMRNIYPRVVYSGIDKLPEYNWGEHKNYPKVIIYPQTDDLPGYDDLHVCHVQPFVLSSGNRMYPMLD